ncbi:MAG: hypothetical protein KAI79_16905, partial [Bacteroidales bacterium]|nr:hypothetical protein [Bacteroidales bacterium]
GHPLISDDKVPTFIKDGKFMAVGSHPYHRPYRKFEELGYRVEKFTDGFKPIHVFYKFESVDGNAEISIEEINGFAKFDALLPNYLYMFSYLQRKRLKYLSTMINNIQCFHVKVPKNMNRLDEVYHKIYAHSIML